MLSKDIYADIYFINEADLVRAGKFVKGLKTEMVRNKRGMVSVFIMIFRFQLYH